MFDWYIYGRRAWITMHALLVHLLPFILPLIDALIDCSERAIWLVARRTIQQSDMATSQVSRV